MNAAQAVFNRVSLGVVFICEVLTSCSEFYP